MATAIVGGGRIRSDMANETCTSKSTVPCATATHARE
jgi:hypothetical protein